MQAEGNDTREDKLFSDDDARRVQREAGDGKERQIQAEPLVVRLFDDAEHELDGKEAAHRREDDPDGDADKPAPADGCDDLGLFDDVDAAHEGAS